MANSGTKENIFLRAGRFIQESRAELLKCSWPTKEELVKSTGMVLLFVLIVTIWIGGLDYLLGLFTRRVIGW